MLASQTVLDALRQIGLNLYERKLWVALLSRGSATAGELSSLAKVPHSRTYDVLESLADKGFVVIQSAKPLKYMAVAPADALQRAQKKLKESVEIKLERMRKMEKSLEMKELEKLYKKGFQLVEPAELTGSLKGRDVLHEQLETTFKKAAKSISILTTKTGLKSIFENHAETLKKAAERGVKIRIAVPLGKEKIPELEELNKYAEIKNVPEKSVAGRFFIVDDSNAFMALTNEEVHPTQDLSLWTQSQHITNDVLVPLFNCLWKNLE